MNDTFDPFASVGTEAEFPVVMQLDITSETGVCSPPVTWPETPLPEKTKKLRLTALDLYDIVGAMDSAVAHNIGTFHMPNFDNLKIKYDKVNREHYLKL